MLDVTIKLETFLNTRTFYTTDSTDPNVPKVLNQLLIMMSGEMIRMVQQASSSKKKV